ncbi:MAG: class I tRNA ligase family protein [Patescibacteria group bacterium]
MTKISFPELEEKMLELWSDKDIFRKTLEKEAPQGDFVFYEGPPTANGKPAIHHVLARSFKDAVPRYKTMRGYRVGRKAGWDTHGLPVELQVEKALEISGKPDIEKYGVKEFNQKCKESVWQYKNDWEKLTERMGYWVDMDDPYVTYDNDYIESLWWIMKEVSKKDLLYLGHKVVPHCPRCGTALSSHEVAQGYKEVKDISVYVKFKLKINNSKLKIDGPVYILSWTTTPWTLPGNVGLAVGEDIEYVGIEQDGDTVFVAKSLVENIFEDPKVVKTIKGKDLVGSSYEPLFPGAIPETADNYDNAYKVWAADFVTTEDGTGVVHTAVMYGEDDYQLGEKVGLPKHHTVSADGKFSFDAKDGVLGELDGMPVKHKDPDVEIETTKVILRFLADNNILLKKEKYTHDYPFCWRCDTPLLYYAKDSWFIAMSKLRDELKENNDAVNWVPGHIKSGRFGEWLDGVKDWAISRERYWGTPLPVWTSEDNSEIEVIGSRKELYERATKETKPTRILIMRHCEGEQNLEGISSDKLEGYALTKKGVSQAEALREDIKNREIDYIYVSPIQRTKETAELINAELNVELIEDDRLLEQATGEWEGMTRAERREDPYYTQRTQYWNSNDEKAFTTNFGKTGESFQDVQKRMHDLFKDIAKKHQGKTVLLVTHQANLVTVLQSSHGYSPVLTQRMFKHERTAPGTKPFEFYFNADGSEFDLHKPFIDDVVIESEKGTKLTRDSAVLDVWFDSGAMPYAQWHYPFERAEYIDEGSKFPADFICEAIDQTRGWFYTLLAVSTLLGKEAPYKNVICLAHINDKEGKKMSKSRGNVVDPWEMMNKYGIDAVRLLFYTMNQPGDTKNFDPDLVEQIMKKNFLILWNVLSFYNMYVKTVEGKYPAEHSTHVLDEWIMAKTKQLAREVTEKMENYDLTMAGRAIIEYIQELSTWYVRRSRDRFKAGGETSAQAVKTLGFVLYELSKLMAPLTPFTAEGLYQELTQNHPDKEKDFKESIHLEDWPEAPELSKEETAALDAMESARKVVEKALAARAEAKLKIRQPLASVTVPGSFSDDLKAIIAEEVNVKKVIDSGEDVVLDTNLTDELKAEGLVRETVRFINSLRKEAKLTINDKVTTALVTKDEVLHRIYTDHSESLQSATLSNTIEVSELSDYDIEKVVSIEGADVKIQIKK